MVAGERADGKRIPRQMPDLRAFCARFALRRREVADAYGCTPGWVSQVLHERVPISDAVRQRLRRAVEVVYLDARGSD